MRLAVLALLLLAGCPRFAAEDNVSAGGDDDASGNVECETAEDCVLATSTCCDCPDYATSERTDSCEDIECPTPPSACPEIAAACVDGYCTTACVTDTCELECDAGFAMDAAGCLVCECAVGGAPEPGCSADADCVAVPADCCGCARGGADTAVPAADADDYMSGLMCESDAACPEVDVCDPAEVPQCVSGQCRLGAAEDADPNDGVQECGRPDLPPCPEGTVCVLNADPDASMQGVGTCQ